MSGTQDSQPIRTVIRVKAVPGASRDAIAGMLGDRIKIRIIAAPEGGKANQAIVALLAKALRCKTSGITLVSGQTHPEKLIAIDGLDTNQVSGLLGFDIQRATQP